MDDLKKRFEGFGKDPSPAVWERIEQELDGGKKPIVPWYFYIAASLIIALGVGYYFGTQSNSMDERIMTEEVMDKNILPADNKNNTVPGSNKDDNEKSNISEIKDEQDLHHETQIADAQNDSPELKEGKNKEKQSIEREDHNLPKNAVAEITPKKESEINAPNEDDNIESKTPSTQNDEGIASSSSSDENSNDNVIAFNESSLDQNINGYPSDNEASSEGHASENDNISALDEFLLSDIESMSPRMTDEVDYVINPKNIGVKKVLPAFDVMKKQWHYNATYLQSLTANSTDVTNNYNVSLPSSLAIEEQIVTIKTTYNNEMPYWLAASAGKAISDNMEVLAGLEYGEMKSTVEQSGLVINKNINKSYGALVGVNYHIKQDRKVNYSIGSHLIVGQSKDNWIRNIPAPANNTGFNQYLITPLADGNEAQINLDTDIINPELDNEKLTTITSEVNATVGFKMLSKYQFDVKPFYKRSLSKKYVGSSVYALPYQIGIGLGLRF